MQKQLIYRHWFVASLIAVVGIGVMLFLLWAASSLALGYAYIPVGLQMTAVLIGLITIIQVWTYYLSYVRLDASGITYRRYSTLFTYNETEVDWNTVQSISVVKPGIQGTLFDFGTLTIQTADARPQMVLTYVPQPAYWQQYIDSNATLGGSAGA